MATSRFFVRLLLVVAAGIGLFLLIGSLLPRQFAFETRIAIQADPERVYPLIEDLRQWQEWTSFNLQNSDLIVTFGAKTRGVDASMTWTEPRGSGKLWITEAVANSEIHYAVEFARFPRMKSEILLQPLGEETGNGTTEVIWKSSGRLPRGPFYGWFGMYFSEGLKRDYQTNLTRLKSAVEREEAVVAGKDTGAAKKDTGAAEKDKGGAAEETKASEKTPDSGDAASSDGQ